MDNKTSNRSVGRSLKEGPVVYQLEDSPIDEYRTKKDLTLAELNHVFKMYLLELGLMSRDISILSQFAVIFNDPRFSTWHTLSKPQQSDALTDQVMMPKVFDELITTIGTTVGDAHIVKGVVKDASQNAIDSFSHAAFLQKKYITRFPGIKIILFMDQVKKSLVLVVVDNGYGEKITKPKKSFTGQEYGDDIASRMVDWVIRRFVENEDGEIRHDIAYTGGQGMAFKKIRIEMQLDIEIHFLASGAVFELRLKSYF